MKEFIQYITTLGNLHDSKLAKISWSAEESVLEIIIGDIYSDFEGYPGYKGQISGRFILREVSNLSIEVNLTEPHLAVYDWGIKLTNSERLKSVIKFSPGGKIDFEFLGVEWKEFA